MAGRRLPKLELASLWPAVAAIALATLLVWNLVPKLVEQSAAVQLGESLRLFTRVLAPEVAREPEVLQARLAEIASGSSLRLTVVSGEGTVLADSARTPPQVRAMDNHARRPEIAAALATGSGSSVRRSATTRVVYAYAARTLTAPDGRLYVLRLAQPLRELDALRGRLAWVMVVAAVVALGVAGVVFLWLSRRFFGPLARMVEGAGALASGDYRQRLETPEEPHLAALSVTLNRLAARVEQQIARVGAERDHLEAIVRSMSDGVLVTDAQGRALLANPELRRLFGLSGEIAGKSPLELVRRPELSQLVSATLERGEDQAAVLEMRVPGRRTVALASTPLARPADDGGLGGRDGVLGVVVVARDVTQATRLDEMRRDFVANVSHELKTPLSAIRAYAETLRDGAIEERPAAQRFVARILDQSRRLQALLDDLLTLSRLEGLEDHRPRAEPVDLLPILRRTVELVEAPARSRSVTVRLEAPPEPVPPVRGDRESLERLATNLLDNAVKYNREGGAVTVRLLRPRARSGEVLLEVADTGIGIPADALARIFERFYRVDKGRSREEGGTGLGLAIVKHVAQSCGGRVDVDSELGVGTTFRVFLPLAERRAASGA
jgi:two-component system phosphate regulon sensor histidine kinase PhoR